MRVRNVNGTSDNKCNCGSWLDHWKKFSRQSLPSHCVEKSCTNPPEVGAHVQKDSSYDSGWYIIPLCQKHNAKTASLEIMDSTVLVSANVAETCGK